MKKSPIRPSAWIFLSGLSLACYIYLHVASLEKFGVCPSSLSTTGTIEELQQEGERAIVLPDVAIIKRAINITKIVNPKD